MRSGLMTVGVAAFDAAAIFVVIDPPYAASVSPPPPLVTKTNGMPAFVTFSSAFVPSFDHSRPYLKTPSMSKAMHERLNSSRGRLDMVAVACAAAPSRWTVLRRAMSCALDLARKWPVYREFGGHLCTKKQRSPKRPALLVLRGRWPVALRRPRRRGRLCSRAVSRELQPPIQHACTLLHRTRLALPPRYFFFGSLLPHHHHEFLTTLFLTPRAPPSPPSCLLQRFIPQCSSS